MELREWEQPIPLVFADVPEFPLEALPKCLADYAKEIALSLEVPLDLPANLMLSAVSAAIAPHVEVTVTPDWIEPVNLYLAITLPPGERKSPVYKKVMATIEAFEERLIEQVKIENQGIQKTRSVKEAEIEDMKKAINKVTGERKRELRLQMKAMIDDLPQLKTIPHLIVDDVTPEKLAILLETNGGCIAIMSSEGGVFGMISGRYSNGDPNLDVYLKSHDAENIRVDRIGRDPVLIKKAKLTMGLTVQPEVLKQLNKKSEIRGRGLTARFLFSLPAPKAGFRTHQHRAIDSSARSQYEQTIETLLEARLPNHTMSREKTNLFLSEEALELLIQFQKKLEKMLQPGGDLDHAKDWASKLPGRVIRLAAVLHSAEQPKQNQKVIDASTMQNAIQLGEYFTEHCIATLELIGTDPDVETAKKIVEWVKRKQFSMFSERDAHQALKGTYHAKKDIMPGFSVLVDRGYIQELPMREHSKGRNPSTRYVVNPLIMGKPELNQLQAVY